MQVSTCWTEELPLNHSLSILRTLALDHATKGGPVGLAIARLISAGQWHDLCQFSLDYTDDWDVYQLIECRQALAFFQKLEDLDIGVDKTQVARDKFWQTEEVCRETNNILRSYRRGSLALLPRGVKLIELARRKIRRVLGRCPNLSELRFHFGPGATTAIRKADACPQAKFASGLHCSADLYSSGLVPSLLREAPHWLDAMTEAYSMDDEGCLYSHVDIEITPGNLVYVPKNAKTYRSIMVEPNLNSFLQQGIRKWIEKRLKAFSLDTSDQHVNARLARRGSLDGSLATLDLSSASDLISYELVQLLLPEEWFRLLRAARTGSVSEDGVITPLEKFSSMGNAITFPLETLIFWAVSSAAPVACGAPEFHANDVGVYGDDIIVPAVSAQQVIWALNFLGFEINRDKSFFEGPFRESCGHDYFKGIDVRPYYQKHLVSGQTLFTLHNYYVRSLDFERARVVLEHIPRPLRIYGPDGYGDGHLVSAIWPRITKAKWLEKGFRGCAFDTFTMVSRKKISVYPGDYVTPLYTVYIKDRSDGHELILGLSEPGEVEFTRSGRPLWVVPGNEGYKRTSIYTYA